eukprot:5543040-Pleurochrysis_carterae.AAC.2
MDADGLTDLVFLSPSGADNATVLHVLFGFDAADPNDADEENRCTAPPTRPLCQPATKLDYKARNFTLPRGWGIQREVRAGSTSRASREQDDEAVWISIGDLNLDGFPELLLPLTAPQAEVRGAARRVGESRNGAGGDGGGGGDG